MAGLLTVIVLLGAIAAVFTLWRRRETVTIYPPMQGLLFQGGTFVRELPQGHYSFANLFHRSRVVKVALVEQPVGAHELNVIARDQFAFRMTLVPLLRVTDARLFVESQAALDGYAYAAHAPVVTGHPELQPRLAAAALQAVGARTLVELLADPVAMRGELLAALASAVPGATVTDVLVTAINLPPEIRKMFTEVERARVEAQAALERARGEQAALRVLANAARLVADNPALANLRLLQAIETSKGPTTIVLGEGMAGGVTGRP